ncbi:MAG: glutaredoxin family protein [Candidatus Woesearchaeota archaeon]
MKLKVYTTKNCPDCKVLKSYLSAINLDFEEVLVNTPELVEHVVQKTGQKKVPVVENGKGFVIGFKPEEIKKLVS